MTMDRGFTVWLTGLSGAGKTTIAGLVGAELERRGHLVEHLDGDVVRTHLSNGLGFSKRDRDANVERIGWIASRLTRHGAAVLVSSISPYQETRQRSRAMVEQFGPFVEVHVRASLDECARRDPKGLYERALAGQIPNFTGVSDPYEPPDSPDLVLDTAAEDPLTSARRMLDRLAQLGLVQAEVAA
ncbi:MAG: adenylyl-sulfate kinase [Acidimicrobiia bacterium]